MCWFVDNRTGLASTSTEWLCNCFSLQLKQYDVQKLDEIFDTEGEGGVTMDLMVNIENLPYLERDLGLTTKGRASLSDVVSELSPTICN